MALQAGNRAGISCERRDLCERIVQSRMNGLISETVVLLEKR